MKLAFSVQSCFPILYQGSNIFTIYHLLYTIYQFTIHSSVAMNLLVLCLFVCLVWFVCFVFWLIRVFSVLIIYFKFFYSSSAFHYQKQKHNVLKINSLFNICAYNSDLFSFLNVFFKQGIKFVRLTAFACVSSPWYKHSKVWRGVMMHFHL